MALMATDNMATNLQPAHDEDDMDLLSDTGQLGNDFDIDLDLADPEGGDHDIDYMIEDVADGQPSGGQHTNHTDDLMEDTIDEGIFEAEMEDDEITMEEQTRMSTGFGQPPQVPEIELQDGPSHEPHTTDQSFTQVFNDVPTTAVSGALVEANGGVPIQEATTVSDEPVRLDKNTDTGRESFDEINFLEGLPEESVLQESTVDADASRLQETKSQSKSPHDIHETESSHPENTPAAAKSSSKLESSDPGIYDAGDSGGLDVLKDQQAIKSYGNDSSRPDREKEAVVKNNSEKVNDTDTLGPEESTTNLPASESGSNDAQEDGFEDDNDYGEGLSIPVMVKYGEESFSLFPVSEGDDFFLLKNADLAFESFTELFRECREVLGKDIPEEEMLCISVDHFGLSISEDSCDCDNVTMAQVIDIYSSIHPNESELKITLTTNPRFCMRLNSLASKPIEVASPSDQDHERSQSDHEHSLGDEEDAGTTNFDDQIEFVQDTSNAEELGIVEDHEELDEYYNAQDDDAQVEEQQFSHKEHVDENDAAQQEEGEGLSTEHPQGKDEESHITQAQELVTTVHVATEEEEDLIDYDAENESESYVAQEGGTDPSNCQYPPPPADDDDSWLIDDGADDEPRQNNGVDNDDLPSSGPNADKVGAHPALEPFTDGRGNDSREGFGVVSLEAQDQIDTLNIEERAGGKDGDETNPQGSVDSITEMGSTSAQPTGDPSGLEWGQEYENEEDVDDLDNIDFGDDDEAEGWQNPTDGADGNSKVLAEAAHLDEEDSITFDEEDEAEDAPQSVDPPKGSSPPGKRSREDLEEDEALEASDPGSWMRPKSNKTSSSLLPPAKRVRSQ